MSGRRVLAAGALALAAVLLGACQSEGDDARLAGTWKNRNATSTELMTVRADLTGSFVTRGFYDPASQAEARPMTLSVRLRRGPFDAYDLLFNGVHGRGDEVPLCAQCVLDDTQLRCQRSISGFATGTGGTGCSFVRASAKDLPRAPEAFADALSGVRSIMVDLNDVYWLDDACAVFKAPRAGGEPKQLGTASLGLSSERCLAAAAQGSYIYATVDSLDFAGGGLGRLPKSGGSFEVLAKDEGGIGSLAMGLDAIAWGAYHSVRLLSPVTGGTPKSVASTTSPYAPIVFGLDSTSAYLWEDSTMNRVARSGGADATELASANGTAFVAGATVLFTARFGNRIEVRSIPKSGGEPTTLATFPGNVDVSGLAGDDGALFVATGPTGALTTCWQIPRSGGAPVAIGESPEGFGEAIAVSGDDVFVERAGNLPGIYRARKVATP